MGIHEETSREEAALHDTEAVLRRILHAVEKDKRRHWVEIICAIVLSLATTASAWCAYEATRWSGTLTFRLAASNKASREAEAAHLLAVQSLTFDASMLISYLDARSRGDKEMEQLLYGRFRPESKKAITAWLKTDPFHNPDSPPNPFKMAEYVQPELIEADKQKELSAGLHAAAREASRTSDTYVLLTVMFASVLFFGGVGGTFDSTRLRAITLVIAGILLAVTLIALGTMPICRG